MKSVIVFACCLVLAVYAQNPADQNTKVLQYINENLPTGEYNYAVELSDGTVRREEAHWEDYGLETQHLAVTGFYEYIGPDGLKYRTDYQANKLGYQPKGDHIPAGAAPLTR